MTIVARGNLKHNAIWAIIGTSATVLSQLATIVVLARLLTPLEFGIVSAATLINQFVMIFAEFGVGPYVVQRADLNNTLTSTAYLISCILGLIITALMVISAPAFALWFHIPELSDVLKAYSVMFLIFGTYAVQDALTQRALDYSYLARSDATSFAIGYAGVSIVCAFLGFSYWSIVIGHISQQLIRCFFLRRRHETLGNYPIDKTQVRNILDFGIGQTLSRIGSYLASQADGFVITSRLGAEAIGNYGRANQLVTMPAAQLGQIFDKLIFPYLARLQHEHTKAATTYLYAVKGICILSIPAAAVIWIYGQNLVSLLLGAQWDAVTRLLQILALAVPFRLVHKVSDPTARAMGKTYSRAWRQWVVAGSLFTFTLALSPLGLVAVAWGVIASAAIDATLMVWLCAKATGIKISQLRNALIPGTLAGLLVFIISSVVTEIPAIKGLSNFFTLLGAGLIYASIVAIFMTRILKIAR